MFKNCPEEYFDNCRNAYIKCKDCAAGEGITNLLYYVPLHGEKKDHPVAKEQAEVKRQEQYQKKKEKATKTKAKSKQSKQAFRKEREVKDDIIKQTVRSGAAFGDGDYQILDGHFQGDHKWHSKSKSFSLSHSEYTKGKKQGTDSWMITNSEDETVVVLTKEAYSKLISLAKEGLKYEH